MPCNTKYMTVLTPSIFYFHHQTVLRLAYLNCVKNFSFPRFLFTTLLLSLHLLGVLIISFGRLVDEIFFRGYKDVDLSDPVFIISNPRCGTTFLHRLLCLDKDRYTFTLLYHTLLPSVFYIKLIQEIFLSFPVLRVSGSNLLTCTWLQILLVNFKIKFLRIL